jgi:hypothetical protein
MSALIIIAHAGCRPAPASPQPAHHRHYSGAPRVYVVSVIFINARFSNMKTPEPAQIMKLREDDIPEVHEEFSLQRPKPQTKESAIITLADAIESASPASRNQHRKESKRS